MACKHSHTAPGRPRAPAGSSAAWTTPSAAPAPLTCRIVCVRRTGPWTTEESKKKDSMTPCKTVYLKAVNCALEKIRIFTQNSSVSPEEAIDPAAASSRTGSCIALPGGSRSAADRRKAPTRGGLNTLKRVQGGFEVFREFQLRVPATP